MLCVGQMQLTFKGVDDEGNPIRRDTAAVAHLMQLPEARIKLMLHRALRAIPLVADDEPITVSASFCLKSRYVSCSALTVVLCDLGILTVP